MAKDPTRCHETSRCGNRARRGYLAEFHLARREALERLPLLDPHAFLVSFTAYPRLPASPLEQADLADDIGWLHIDGSRLVYRGDRVALELVPDDVYGFRWTFFGPNLLCLVLAPDEFVHLSEPLGEVTRLRFGIREGALMPTTLHRGLALCRALERWASM